MAEAIDDAIRRSEELATLGLARAAQFTWEATAAAHDAVYRDAAS
jgi:hypothetical protein